jgi:hypothetical protein
MARYGQRVYVEELKIEGTVFAKKGNKITHILSDEGKIIDVIDKTIKVITILKKLWLIIRSIFTILLMLCFVNVEAQNVQFRQLPRTPNKFHIVSAYDSINATNYALRYIGIDDLLDSLDINTKDSIYLQNDTIFLRDGSGFVDASGFGGGGSNWTVNGTHIYNSNSGNVGIGVTNPGFKLDVSEDARLNGVIYGSAGTSPTNVKIGLSLSDMTTGTHNIGIGNGAGMSLTTQSYNLAIGEEALRNFTGIDIGSNIAIGRQCMRDVTGGTNIAIGARAMQNFTSNSSVAIGASALRNGTGSGNFALGTSSMQDFTGTASIAIGANAPLRSGGGIRNTAIGSQAMSSNTRTGGNHNTAIGARALQNVTTASDNTAIGEEAGANISTGVDNTILGRFAFHSSNVNRAIGLGRGAGRYETQNDRLYITSITSGVTNETTGRDKAIIYGVQNNTTANQILDLNAKVKATYKPNTATGIAGYDADGYFSNVTLGSGLTITSGTLSATGGGGGGIDTLNGLTATNQTFETGTTGTDFNINSSGSTHTFNLPTASATNRGALSSADWTSFNAKPNGSGVFNKVAFWSGTNTLTSKTEFHWDNTNNRLGIGTSTPDANIHTTGTLRVGNRTPAQPGTVAGWTANGDAATVTIGTGLQLSFGTLSSTVVNTDNQQLSRTGNTLNLTNSSSLTNALVSTGGTNGQVLTWNSGTYAWATPSGASNWTLSGSNLFPNSTATNVIIGSTGTAARKLHVQGDMRVTSLVGNPNTIIGTNNNGDVGAFFGGANIFVGGGIISGENWYAQRASAATQSITIGTSYVKVPIGTISADYTSNGPGLNANPSGSGNDNTILITQQGDYEFTFCTCFQGNADDATYMDYLLYSATNGNGSPTTHNRLYMRETWTFGIPSCISKSVIITINTGNNNRYWSIRAKKNAGSSNTVDFYNPTFTIKRLK